jgi:Mor family transcriptional regulator
MGGGHSQTNQVQEFMTDTVTNLVNEELTQESSSLSQSGFTNQIMTNVVFKPWDGCPWWAPPRNLTVTQESISAMVIAKSIERLNTADLTNKIVSTIEAMSGNKVDKRKDGLLAFTDSTDANQRITVSEKTRTNILKRINDTVTLVLNQRMDTGQTISGATFYLPCGDTTVTQTSVTKMMASVFGKNITETVMEATEVRNWVSKITSEDKQHSTDLFNSLFNNTASAINGIASAIGSIGSSYGYAVGLVIGAFILLILLSVFGSGGGGRRRRSDDDD